MICDTCVFIEFPGSCRLAALNERPMCRLNREPVFISIFLDSEIDVEVDVVVAEASSDDPLARLGFGPKQKLKLFIVGFVCLLKRRRFLFHRSMVHSLG